MVNLTMNRPLSNIFDLTQAYLDLQAQLDSLITSDITDLTTTTPLNDSPILVLEFLKSTHTLTFSFEKTMTI